MMHEASNKWQLKSNMLPRNDTPNHKSIASNSASRDRDELIRCFEKRGEHQLSAFSQEQCTRSMRLAAPVPTKFNSIMFVELIIFESSSFSSPSCVVLLFCAETTMRSHSKKNGYEQID